jgi:hypothetical protein
MSRTEQVEVVGIDEGRWISRVTHEGINVDGDQLRAIDAPTEDDMRVPRHDDLLAASETWRSARTRQVVSVGVAAIGHGVVIAYPV